MNLKKFEDKLNQFIVEAKRVEKEEYNKYPGKASSKYWISVGEQLAYGTVLKLLKKEKIW